MNVLVRACLLAIFLCVPHLGVAQEINVGKGLVCDQASEVETFLAGTDAQATLATINADKNACAVIAVAFLKGDAVKTVRTQKGTYVVTQITIVGIQVPGGFQAVPPTVQFTMFSIKEEEA